MQLPTNQTLYARSGTLLSRSIFCKIGIGGSFGEVRKHLFLFESFAETKQAKKVLEFVLGRGLEKKAEIREIKTVSDATSYFESENGYFIGTPGMFDSHLRYDYLRKTQSLEIVRTAKIGPRAVIERLVELGYEHSPHLSKAFSYHLQGSELAIQTPTWVVYVSFFDEEVDDILVSAKTGGTSASGETPERRESIRIPGKQSDSLPEAAKKIQNLDAGGMVWTFDLDFFAERNELRSQFEYWIGFEGSGTVNLESSPLRFDDLEELTGFLKDQGSKAVLYTNLTDPVWRYLEYNGLSTSIVPTPKLPLESTGSPEASYVCDDVLGNLFVQKRSRKQTMRTLDLLMTLKPGDFVVHQEHGIGKFVEMLEKEVAGVTREYVSIEYADHDKLFVPITELYRVTKYLGDENPTVHALGGTVWKKTLRETEADILKTAEELLDMYARRKVSPGYRFSSNPTLEQEFLREFPYEHTPDQRASIEEIFADMEKPEPMDRLLCGDVGFWKTEVAMNAAYKAVLSGKQVAVISPLVVLTLEHFESFSDRFAGKGIRIASLSRLSSARETRETLAGLKDGTVDIVIATHRLLGDDVTIRRLGLLIVDEEHRFGVIDKEKIKKLRTGLDILSLSATPIPRSLNLALSWLRTMSILTTPPPSKKPIQTQVLKWNPEVIKTAIEYELWRAGQIIFLHNRVASLDGTVKELQSLVWKKLKPIMLHGQMRGEEIEDTLLRFRSLEANCLVTTTVIENGVNFLEANTILIDHADEFGLAQLHQLRGRVGRKDRDAHCILIYRKEVLPDDSKKRLLAIVEHAHLGAGFEIAMRDLEIRGAGEILGIAQSGKSKQTGVSLYLKLLENKIEELQTGKKHIGIDVKIELDIEFVLPENLFSGDIDKVQFYRSLEGIEDIEDLESAYASFVRMHGEHEPLRRLFLLLRARILLARYWVCAVKKVLRDYVFDFRGADTTVIRNFLAIDQTGEFLVQSLERIRVAQSLYSDDLDFLTKLVYSLEQA